MKKFINIILALAMLSLSNISLAQGPDHKENEEAAAVGGSVVWPDADVEHNHEKGER